MGDIGDALDAKNVFSAKPTFGFDKPPYHVESFYHKAHSKYKLMYLERPALPQPQKLSAWHCVCNRDGFNCLNFPDKPGVKFTTLEYANTLCETWNREASTR